MPSVAIVPAAGKAERFGGAKLLARIGGDVLLDRTLGSLLDGGVDRAIVVVAPRADFRASRRLADARVQVIVNPDPSRGMFSSIRAGLAVADGDPVLVLPADMPFVTPVTVAAVLRACVHQHGIVAPVYSGRRGHPVALPASMRSAILREPPETTLKAALAATGAAWTDVAVDDAGILRDVDRPADLSLGAKRHEP
jgi:molybdenum cofactor cytidylyltransferase